MKWEAEWVRERGAETLDREQHPIEIYRFLQGLRLHSGQSSRLTQVIQDFSASPWWTQLDNSL